MFTVHDGCFGYRNVCCVCVCVCVLLRIRLTSLSYVWSFCPTNICFFDLLNVKGASTEPWGGLLARTRLMVWLLVQHQQQTSSSLCVLISLEVVKSD